MCPRTFRRLNWHAHEVQDPRADDAAQFAQTSRAEIGHGAGDGDTHLGSRDPGEKAWAGQAQTNTNAQQINCPAAGFIFALGDSSFSWTNLIFKAKIGGGPFCFCRGRIFAFKVLGNLAVWSLTLSVEISTAGQGDWWGRLWRGGSGGSRMVRLAVLAGVLSLAVLSSGQDNLIFQGGAAKYYDSFNERLSEADFPGADYCNGRKLEGFGRDKCEANTGCCYVPPINEFQPTTEKCLPCQDIR